MKRALACLLSAALLSLSWPAAASRIKVPSGVQGSKPALGTSAPVPVMNFAVWGAAAPAPAALPSITPSPRPASSPLVEARVPVLPPVVGPGATAVVPAIRGSAPKPEAPQEKASGTPDARRSLKALSRRLGGRGERARSSAVEVNGRLGWFDQSEAGGPGAAAVGAELSGRSRRGAGLRAAAAGKGAPEAAEEDLPRLALTLPARPGTEPRRLEAELVRHHQHETAGLTGRYVLPPGGLLLSGEQEGFAELWHKNVHLVTDLVFLDAEGAIQEILAGVPPSPPGTLWPEVPIYEGYGAHVLVLEAGRARALGLQPGQRIGGLESAEPLLEEVRYREDAEEPVTWLMAGGPEGLDRFLKYIKAFPRHTEAFDRALKELNLRVGRARREGSAGLEEYRRIRRDLIRRVMVDKGFENQGQLEGLISTSNPWLWFRHLSWGDKLFLPLFMGVLYPPIFVHEFGHYLAFRLFGVPVRRFQVGLNGNGYVAPGPGREGLAAWKDAVVSAAGPAAEGLLGAAALAAGAALSWAAANALLLTVPALDPYWLAALTGGVYLAFLGLLSLLSALPSGAHDWPDAAEALGFRRLAREMYWRVDKKGQGVTGIWAAMASQGASYLLRRLTRRVRPPLEPERLELKTRLRGDFRKMTAVAMDPAAERAASAGFDGLVHVWDLLTGRQLDLLPDDVEGAGNVYVLQFSPDGRRLAVAKEDGRIHLWDLSEHGSSASKVFGELLPGEKVRPTLRALEFSPDGAWLVSGDEKGKVTLWDVESGEPLRAFSVGDSVIGAAFSPDGKRLAVVDRGGTSRVWDTGAPGGPIGPEDGGKGKGPAAWGLPRRLSFPVAEHARDPEDEENAAAFSPDGRLLAVGTADGRGLLVWDLEAAEAAPRVLPAAEAAHSWIVGVAFSPDGRFVAAGDLNGNVHVWPLGEEDQAPFHQRLEDVVFGVRFDPSGGVLVAVDREGGVSRFYR